MTTFREEGQARLDQKRRIFGGGHSAEPPCPGRVSAPRWFAQHDGRISLADRLMLRTAKPCGKPAGHAGEHAPGGCGCPDWDFDQQRCYCYELRHADCLGCY